MQVNMTQMQIDMAKSILAEEIDLLRDGIKSICEYKSLRNIFKSSILMQVNMTQIQMKMAKWLITLEIEYIIVGIKSICKLK